MDSLLTVTVAASGATAFDLTTLSDVKADLSITGASDDVILARYITESSLQFARACNRDFARETVSEQYRPEESKALLIVTRRPVVSITSIAEDGTALTVSDWETDLPAGLIYRLRSDYRCWWMAAKIVVVYVAGHTLPAEAPADLQKAARALVKAQWLSKGRDPLVRNEAVPGVYEVAYWVGGLPGGSSWPAEIEAAIAAYRNPLV